MSANNQVILTGHLGAAPKYIASDKRPFVAFSLATQDRYLDKDNNWQSKATAWHQVLVFGKSLIDVAQKLEKGSRIKLTGSLSYKSFEALQEGRDPIKKQEATIIAETIEPVPLPVASNS